MLAGQRHQTTIAEVDLALFRRGIALFANGDKFRSAHHEPTVAVRIGRPETEHRNCRAVRKRCTQSRQAFGAHQRRVGEHHQNIIGAFGRLPCAPTGRRGRCRAARAARRCAPSVQASVLPPRPPHGRARPRPPNHGFRQRPLSSITWASKERPPSACNTFGVRDRMRVPSPAASTIARHVRRRHYGEALAFAEVRRIP